MLSDNRDIGLKQSPGQRLHRHTMREQMLSSEKPSGMICAGNEERMSTALDERVCKECQALEGVQISMDDSFETQSGRRNVTVLLPPLHPRCKCAVKYVEATYEIV